MNRNDAGKAGKQDETGAVDLNECPTGSGNRCRCGFCTCGYRKHTAIHGPFYGQPAGSKPYGHRFEARDKS